MKSITPSLTVDDCSKALEYYKNLFGGEVTRIEKADGKEMFAGHEGKIIHSELHIAPGCVLYLVHKFNDDGPAGSNISLVLEMGSEEEINRVYEALSKEGSVSFALQKTFWGAYHAVVVDPFGVTWSLNLALNG